jgi:hypothetical protein
MGSARIRNKTWFVTRHSVSEMYLGVFADDLEQPFRFDNQFRFC